MNNDEIDELVFFFNIFSDKTRMCIISLLSKGTYTVNQISIELNISQSSVSHQLAYLRNLQIVKCDQVGKFRQYSLIDQHIKTIYEMSLEHIREDSTTYKKKHKN